jgi:hypothetical protein
MCRCQPLDVRIRIDSLDQVLGQLDVSANARGEPFVSKGANDHPKLKRPEETT